MHSLLLLELSLLLKRVYALYHKALCYMSVRCCMQTCSMVARGRLPRLRYHQ